MQKLTIERIAIITVFAMIFVIALRPPTDTDTWWHIRSGEHTLEQGIIFTDPFSHTLADEAWINHSWGSQILMVGVWRLGGNVGLALYTSLFAVAGMALLYQISAGNTYLKAFVLILGAITAAIFWSARPQMLSFFFSTLILWLVYRYKRQDIDWLWAIIPLMWLWSNLHAGWAIGYLFLIAFIVGEAFNNVLGSDENKLSWADWRKLVLATIISIPFLALSPYLLDNMLVPFNTVNIEPLRALIREWQSPQFQTRGTWAFIAMIMLLFMALWTSKLKFDWSSFFLLIGTLFLALLYARNIAVFAVVATPILTYHLDNALTERKIILRPRQRVPRQMALINLALVVIILLGVGAYAVSVLNPETIAEAQANVLPTSAVAYLNENDVPTPIFNSYNWGGYLIFEAPDYPVFVDGRTDLYGDFILDFNAIYNNHDNNALEELDARGINSVLVEVSAPINTYLEDSNNWNLDYNDDLAMIWVRSNNNE